MEASHSRRIKDSGFREGPTDKTTSHQVQGGEVKPVWGGKLSSETDTGSSWPSPTGLSTLRCLSLFQVTKDSWDHQDPKVTRVRRDPEASQGSLAFEVCLELWVNPEPKAQWVRLALMDSKVPEVNKA